MIKPKMTTIKNAIDTFSIYLYRQDKTKSTKNAYLKDLDYFYLFIRENLNNKIRYAEQITLVEIMQYKDYLLEKLNRNEFKRSTIDRKFNALKTFFNHLEEDYSIKNIIKHDKFGNKKRGKNAGRDYLPNVLNKGDINCLLNIIKNNNDKDKYRALAIFQLLINIGCRRSEVLGLKWKDINLFDDEIIICREKTNNADVLPLSQSLKKALLDYRETLTIQSEYVFISRQSDHLSKTGFSELINKYIKLSELENKKGFKITAHTFRHTFITTCVKADMSLEKICRFTGHKDKDTLSIYSHLKTEDIKDITDIMENFIAV